MSGLTSIEREMRLKRAEIHRAEANNWVDRLDLAENHPDTITSASQAILALCALAQLEIELAREGWRTNR